MRSKTRNSALLHSLALLAAVILPAGSCSRGYAPDQLRDARNLVLGAVIKNDNGTEVTLGKAIYFYVEAGGGALIGSDAVADMKGERGPGIRVFALWKDKEGHNAFADWLLTENGELFALNDIAKTFGAPKLDQARARRIFSR
jgi:hypothetical protein